MSQGFSTQDKLHQALRYLRETGKYALAQPVPKKPDARPPILTQWVQQRRAA